MDNVENWLTINFNIWNYIIVNKKYFVNDSNLISNARFIILIKTGKYGILFIVNIEILKCLFHWAYKSKNINENQHLTIFLSWIIKLGFWNLFFSMYIYWFCYYSEKWFEVNLFNLNKLFTYKFVIQLQVWV